MLVPDLGGDQLIDLGGQQLAVLVPEHLLGLLIG